MKMKHVITTFSLSIALGLGVCAGAGLANRSAKEVKATGTETIYLTPGVWNTAGAKFSVYSWGGAAAATSAFMTPVATDATTYETTIPDDNNNIIFIRNKDTAANPGFDDKWNQTADLTKDENRYTITGWGDSDGAWSNYVPPAAAVNYQVTINDGTPINLVQNGSTSEYCFAADRALVAGDELEFFADDVLQAVTVKADNGTSTNNVQSIAGVLTVTKSATTNLYWDISSDELWVGGYGNPVDEAVYFVGTFNGWGGIRNPAQTADNKTYTISNLVLAPNAELKAYQYDAATPKQDWVQPTAVSSSYPIEYPISIESENVKVANAGTYDVSVNIETGAYRVVPKTDLPVYTAVYNNLSGEPIALAQDIGDLPDDVVNQFSATFANAGANKTVQFYLNGTEITSNLTVSAAANAIMGDTTNGFRFHNSADGTKVYFKQFSDGSYEVWASGDSVEGFWYNDVNLSYDDGYSGEYMEQYYAPSTSYTAGQELPLTGNTSYGYSFPVTVENVAGNNLYTEGGKIYVHNACSEVLYVKRNATNGAFVLYLGGYEDNYVLNIGGVEHALTKFDANQYRVTGVDLVANQQISCTKEGASHAITAKAIGNNNLQSNLKVLANAEDADIYLDTSTDELWVGGLGLENATGFHLLVSGDAVNFVKLVQNPSNSNEYYIGSYTFNEDDKIEVVDCTHVDELPIVFDPDNGLNDYSDDRFEVSAGHVICNTDSTTVGAYFQLDAGKLYFGEVEAKVKKAIEFATDFASGMSAACSQVNKQDSVEAAWAASATVFAALDDDVKAVLRAGIATPEIEAFLERYIAIKQQHSTWELANFLGIDIPAPSNNVVGIFNNQNNTVLVIIIASVAAVSAVGLFFVIKKRKHN